MRSGIGNGAAYRRARMAVITEAIRSSAVCDLCLLPLGRGPIEADHIVRVADGGTDDPRNLRAVHRSCNLAREHDLPLPRSRYRRR